VTVCDTPTAVPQSAVQSSLARHKWRPFARALLCCSASDANLHLPLRLWTLYPAHLSFSPYRIILLQTVSRQLNRASISAQSPLLPLPSSLPLSYRVPGVVQPWRLQSCCAVRIRYVRASQPAGSMRTSSSLGMVLCFNINSGYDVDL
jgi:hypothetical protein